MSKKSKKQVEDVPVHGLVPTDAPVSLETPVVPEVAPVPAPAAGNVDLTLKLPKKGKEKVRQRVKLAPGEVGKIKLGQDELLFQLPEDTTEPATIAIATPNISWLGREGEGVRLHICESEHGVVVLMPQHDKSWKANAFSKGKITHKKL